MKRCASYEERGAITVLLITLLVFSIDGAVHRLLVSFYSLVFPHSSHDKELLVIGTVFFLLLIEAILYPLGGWLADVYFGRYRVIQASLWGMWGSIIVFTGGVLVGWQLNEQLYIVRVMIVYAVLPISFISLMVCFTSFSVNSLSFCLDNLTSANTVTLQRYVYYYVWSMKVGELVSLPAQFTICSRSIGDIETGLLYGMCVCVCLSIGVCLYHLSNGLNTHFQPQNPIKLIYSVVMYALKHKAPQRRSAFTYCLSYTPTRVDFCKTEYGGPFAEEKVEDVKTFGRIIMLLPVFTLVAVIRFGLEFILDKIPFKYGKVTYYLNQQEYCAWEVLAVYYCSRLVVIIGIPFYLLLNYFKVVQWCPTALRKIGLGLFLSFLNGATVLSLTLSHQLSTEHGNTTALGVPPSFNYLIILPFLLKGFSTLLYMPAIFEFIVAQSPHTMQGMIIGVGYSSQCLSQIVAALIYVIMRNVLPIPSKAVFNSYTIYVLLITSFGLFSLVVYVVASCRYTLRSRGDIRTVFRFVDDYYSKIVALEPRTEENDDNDDETLHSDANTSPSPMFVP